MFYFRNLTPKEIARFIRGTWAHKSTLATVTASLAVCGYVVKECTVFDGEAAHVTATGHGVEIDITLQSRTCRPGSGLSRVQVDLSWAVYTVSLGVRANAQEIYGATVG